MALFKNNRTKIADALKEAHAELAVARRDMQLAAYEAALADDPAAAQPSIDRVSEISRKIELLEIAQNEAHRQERESGIAKASAAHRSWWSKLRHELDEVERFQARTANALATVAKNYTELVEHAKAAIELLSLAPELTSMENPGQEWLDPARLADDLLIELYRLTGGPTAAFPLPSHKDAIHHGLSTDNNGQIEPIGRILRDQIAVIERVVAQVGAEIAAGKRSDVSDLVGRASRATIEDTPRAIPAVTANGEPSRANVSSKNSLPTLRCDDA
jgi:hypothetical protein